MGSDPHPIGKGLLANASMAANAYPQGQPDQSPWISPNYVAVGRQSRAADRNIIHPHIQIGPVEHHSIIAVKIDASGLN